MIKDLIISLASAAAAWVAKQLAARLWSRMHAGQAGPLKADDVCFQIDLGWQMPAVQEEVATR